MYMIFKIILKKPFNFMEKQLRYIKRMKKGKDSKIPIT